MKVHWNEVEVLKVALKLREFRITHRAERPLSRIRLAMKAVLPQNRWRPLEAGIRYVPERLLQELYRDELPDDLKHHADIILHETPTPIMATKPEEKHVLVAREMARQRIEHPTADILIIYNNAREAFAPDWPEVTSVKYMRQDAMDQLLLELEDLTRPKPVEPVEKPLNAYQKQCMVVGEAIGQLMSMKQSTQQIGDGEITKRFHNFEVALLGQLEQRFAGFKKEVEDAVMGMLVPVEKKVEPSLETNGAHQSPQPPTPPAAPASIPDRRFRVIIVDAMMTGLRRHVEAKMPNNVKLEVGNADHNPPSTLSIPHFFIHSHRTPMPWLRAYRSKLNSNRIIELKGGGAEDVLAVLQDISKKAWFERS